jgi:DNA-binding MarR family transcriptional regulator
MVRKGRLHNSYQARTKEKNREKIKDLLRARPGQTFGELLENSGFSPRTLSGHLKGLIEAGDIEKRLDEKKRKRVGYHLTESGMTPIERWTSRLRVTFRSTADESSLTQSRQRVATLRPAIEEFCEYFAQELRAHGIRVRTPEEAWSAPYELDPDILNAFFAHYYAESRKHQLYRRIMESNQKAIEEEKKRWSGDFQQAWDMESEFLSKTAKICAIDVSQLDTKFTFLDEEVFNAAVKEIQREVDDLSDEFVVLALLHKHKLSSTTAEEACRAWLRLVDGVQSLALNFQVIHYGERRLIDVKCILLGDYRISKFQLVTDERWKQLERRGKQTEGRIFSKVKEKQTPARARELADTFRAMSSALAREREAFLARS